MSYVQCDVQFIYNDNYNAMESPEKIELAIFGAKKNSNCHSGQFAQPNAQMSNPFSVLKSELDKPRRRAKARAAAPAIRLRTARSAALLHTLRSPTTGLRRLCRAPNAADSADLADLAESGAESGGDSALARLAQAQRHAGAQRAQRPAAGARRNFSLPWQPKKLRFGAN